MPRQVIGREREQETAMTLWKGADELGRLIATVQKMGDEMWPVISNSKSQGDAADTVVIDGVKVMRALRTLALALDRTILARADAEKPSILTHFIAVWQDDDGQWTVSRDRIGPGGSVHQVNACEVYRKFGSSRELAFKLAGELASEQRLVAFWYDEDGVSRPITHVPC
jgi:hypothetical protein